MNFVRQAKLELFEYLEHFIDAAALVLHFSEMVEKRPA